MLWIVQTALLAPEVRRLRPFGFGFGLGHNRLGVLLVVLLIVLVIAAISRHNRR